MVNTEIVPTVTLIKRLITNEAATPNDIYYAAAVTEALIGDSTENPDKDAYTLLHIARLALETMGKLPLSNDCVQALLNLATKCVNRADWIGPFDDTDEEWMLHKVDENAHRYGKAL